MLSVLLILSSGGVWPCSPPCVFQKGGGELVMVSALLFLEGVEEFLGSGGVFPKPLMGMGKV